MTEHCERELLEVLRHISQNIKHQNELLHKAMTAIETLTASVTAATGAVTALTTAVDTAVTDLGATSASDAAILGQANAVDALTAAVTAQTGRLNAATATPAPAPTP